MYMHIKLMNTFGNGLITKTEINENDDNFMCWEYTA